MGIMDFIREGTQEMLIHRPDEHKNLIIYKHPENTIPKWAQLTIDADESAVFSVTGHSLGPCVRRESDSAIPSMPRIFRSWVASSTTSPAAISS